MQAATDVIYTDLGEIEYEMCWKLQQRLFDGLTAAKRAGDGNAGKQHLLLCEHPHVYTLGKSGLAENLLVGGEALERIGATCLRIDRGGDITYHGPGQLVGYPILDLEVLGMGLKEYVHALEETVIATLAEFGIAAGRCNDATGVWIGSELPTNNPAVREKEQEPPSGSPTAKMTGITGAANSVAGDDPAVVSVSRKICAVGVRSSRFVTMHGFALNVNTDLSYFGYINPCGFTDRGVTSMERELGRAMDMEAVKAACLKNFEKIMNIKIKKNDYANHKTLDGETSGRPRDGS